MSEKENLILRIRDRLIWSFMMELPDSFSDLTGQDIEKKNSYFGVLMLSRILDCLDNDPDCDEVIRVLDTTINIAVAKKIARRGQ